MVVSDGLNANALNEQLRGMLPGVRQALAAAGHHVGERDVVVRNGRVRAGYDVGGRAGADVVVHFIGERPGTGLNTLSAYVTYGRDAAGAPRWSRDLPHSATTAVCGIHQRGKPPEAAIAGNRQNRGAGGLAAPLRRGARLEPLTATTRVPPDVQAAREGEGMRTISAVAVAAGCLGRPVPLIWCDDSSRRATDAGSVRCGQGGRIGAAWRGGGHPVRRVAGVEGGRGVHGRPRHASVGRAGDAGGTFGGRRAALAARRRARHLLSDRVPTNAIRWCWRDCRSSTRARCATCWRCRGGSRFARAAGSEDPAPRRRAGRV